MHAVNVEKLYRDADKSLARPEKKQANVSVRMAWISFSTLRCREKKPDDSLRLDVVEIACPCHASELVSFLVGLRTYQHPSNGLYLLMSCVQTVDAWLIWHYFHSYELFLMR